LALEIMLNIEGSHIDCVPTCIKFWESVKHCVLIGNALSVCLMFPVGSRHILSLSALFHLTEYLFYLITVVCHFLLLLCHMSALWWHDKWAGRKCQLVHHQINNNCVLKGHKFGFTWHVMSSSGLTVSAWFVSLHKGKWYLIWQKSVCWYNYVNYVTVMRNIQGRNIPYVFRSFRISVSHVWGFLLSNAVSLLLQSLSSRQYSNWICSIVFLALFW
jgi:hypothetical protein